jgi:hypothetical protein
MNKTLLGEMDKFLSHRGITLSEREHSKLKDFFAEKKQIGSSFLEWVYSIFLRLLRPKTSKSHTEESVTIQDAFQIEHERFCELSNYCEFPTLRRHRLSA